MRVGSALLLAGLTLLVAACGGGGGRNALPAAADIVPASAAALITIDTDTASAEWHDVRRLARRFPDGRRELENLDFLRPGLGPELDVVWLDFRNGGDEVMLTKPKTSAGYRKLLAPGDLFASERIGDWVVISGDQTLIGDFKRLSRGKKLRQDSNFRAAMADVEPQAAVRAWARGAVVQEFLDDALERSGAPPHLTPEVGRLESLSASIGAEAKGVRFEGGIAVDPALAPEPFAATLPRELPAGALAYVSANSLDDMTRTVLRLVARSFPNFERQLSQVEAVLGFQVRTDVLPLLAHEAAFAIYPARPLPTFVVVIKVGDTAKAKRIFGRLAAAVALGASIHMRTIPVGGVDVTELDFPRASGPPVKTYFAAFAGKFAFTTAESTMRQLVQGPSAALDADRAFEAAEDDADMPAKTAGFAYANLRDGLPFAFRLAEARGGVVPPEARTNTRPLRTALVYAHEDGKLLRLSGFATIK
jgi:hypothetical protein